MHRVYNEKSLSYSRKTGGIRLCIKLVQKIPILYITPLLNVINSNIINTAYLGYTITTLRKDFKLLGLWLNNRYSQNIVQDH